MPRPLLITVPGTGVSDPYGFGFQTDLGAALNDPWNDILAQFRGAAFANIYEWQGIGYRAATFQMGASVQEGRAEVNRQIDRRPRGTPIVLVGYSQGALVTDYVWRDDFLGGRLRDRVDDVIGIVNFGDPMRCPGICNGNRYAGLPLPATVDGFTTGGIAGPNDLHPEHTPAFLMSCNNDGDLYGAAPVGDVPWTQETGVGHDETLIFNLVQSFNGQNLLAFVEEAMMTLGVAATGGFDLATLVSTGMNAIVGALGPAGIPGIPASGAKTPSHVVSIVQALLNGGMFVFRGFGPHGDYGKYVPAMTEFLTEVGHKALVKAAA